MTKTPRTRSRSPEYRLAARALHGLREDLLCAPLAFRPLPPLAADGALPGRAPARLREPARWSVHALVAALAFIAFLIGVASEPEPEGLVYGLLSAIPIALTLIRPVLAWWTGLLAAPVTGGLGAFGSAWPWPPAAVVTILVVTTVVAARSRPRTAAWMWGITVLYALLWVGQGPFGPAGSPYDYNAPGVLVAVTLALLAVTLVHVRRADRREIVAQKSVTAVERDRRTLLEERTNIARELHDVVAHHMSVVAIQAEAAPYRVQHPPPELEQAFVTIRENAVAALTELRRVLGVVRAADYEAPDAPQPRLADLTRLLSNVRDTGLDVEQATTGAVRELPQGVELSAYRIVQEALSNVLRHAPGAAARVEVGYVLGGLGLRVVNGPGTVDAPPSPGAGHGVTGMRERVAMLGGEMTAEPTADGGFEVTVFVPVGASEAVRDAVPVAGRGPGAARGPGVGDGAPGAAPAGAPAAAHAGAVEDAVPHSHSVPRAREGAA